MKSRKRVLIRDFYAFSTGECYKHSKKKEKAIEPGGKHPLTPESKIAVESQPKRFAGKNYPSFSSNAIHKKSLSS